MTPQLISVSRRTDIPAFYGDWLLRRVAAGFAGWENPFGGQRRLVSLRRGDVSVLAFWSKNFRPFLPHLRTLQALGYPCFFNYTITGLPPLLEPHGVPAEDAVDSLRELAGRFSPGHIHWRYDPIVLSDLTPPAYHRARFTALAAALAGCTTRCIVSFVWRYRRVERRFAALAREHGLRVAAPDLAARRALADDLASIAAAHGMELLACCGDDLVSGRVGRACCLDGAQMARLYPGTPWCAAPRPSRPGCGCARNVDIGRYDTCPHGCAYCYANADPQRAAAACRAHDPDAAFLGMSREEADRCVAELQAAGGGQRRGGAQPELPLDGAGAREPTPRRA
jgi:hypothetical protein